HRKERINMIEKISDISNGDNAVNIESVFGKMSNDSKSNNSQFISLRFGSVFLGVGLGLLCGFFITYIIYGIGWTGINSDTYDNSYFRREVIGMIYGACTLIFGGISLLLCFVFEQKLRKKDK
ncbi:MAG: hypothetical protein RR388_08255, partial [Rikenellaceae bacterium]